MSGSPDAAAFFVWVTSTNAKAWLATSRDGTVATSRCHGRHAARSTRGVRAAARAAKDWGTADAIRDRLAEAGIVVEDGADGARWSLQD